MFAACTVNLPDSLLPHVVIFFEQSVVFNRPLLELHVYAAAVDADDAPDATDESKQRTK